MTVSQKSSSLPVNSESVIDLESVVDSKPSGQSKKRAIFRGLTVSATCFVSATAVATLAKLAEPFFTTVNDPYKNVSNDSAFMGDLEKEAIVFGTFIGVSVVLAEKVYSYLTTDSNADSNQTDNELSTGDDNMIIEGKTDTMSTETQKSDDTEPQPVRLKQLMDSQEVHADLQME